MAEPASAREATKVPEEPGADSGMQSAAGTTRFSHVALLRRLLGAVVVFALLAELCARIFLGNAAIQPLLQYDPGDGRWVGLRANQHISYTGWFLRIPQVEHDVNALGFRGPPIAPRRERSIPRIAVIGDSFTYGIGVGADDAIPSQLQRIVAAQTGHAAEVLNFGIPGLNVEEVVDQFERFASLWSPDLVLYVAWSNDLDEGIRGGSMSILFKEGWGARIIRVSRFARLVYIAWAAVMRGEGQNLIQTSSLARFVYSLPAIRPEEQGAPSTIESDAVSRFMNSVRRLSSSANRNQARLGLVSLGWPLAPDQQPEVASALAAADIPVLDVSSVASNRDNVLPMEGHLNRDGCGAVARAIAQWLGDDARLRSAFAQGAGG